MAPEGSAVPTPKPRPDETLIKALVRAHRWRRKIESGQAKSITDLAEQEGVADAYVCRLLPLTCLAPDIVEVILDGRQPKALRLAEMLGNGPLDWNEQRVNWRYDCRAGGNAPEGRLALAWIIHGGRVRGGSEVGWGAGRGGAWGANDRVCG